jgi:hypothetical protein
MKTRKHVAIAAAIALCLTSLASASPLSPKLEDNYSVFVFGERKKQGDFAVVAGVREYQGQVAVCGLVFFLPGGLHWKSSEPKATQKLKFSIGGKKLVVQTGAFRRYMTEDQAMQGEAGCSLTGVPWLPAYATMPLDMEAGRVVVTES